MKGYTLVGTLHYFGELSGSLITVATLCRDIPLVGTLHYFGELSGSLITVATLCRDIPLVNVRTLH